MEKSSLEWAIFNLKEFEKCLGIWERSISRSNPDFDAVLGAYRHLYGAEINFKDAGDRQGFIEVEKLRKRLAKIIVKMMKACGPAQSLYIWNSYRS